MSKHLCCGNCANEQNGGLACHVFITLFQGERVHTSCHITVPTLIVEITFIPVAVQLLSAVFMHRN